MGIGFVLIGTALLKAVSRSSSVSPLAELASPGWLNVVAVPFEFLLGAWLIVGVRRLAAWGVAVAAFVLFALVSLWGGWSATPRAAASARLRLRPGPCSASTWSRSRCC